MKFFHLVVAVISTWIITAVVIISFIPDWETRGQFGDLFGSVNALFSGLAFAGLYYTIYLQRKQLELQQNELQLQREELKLQREEMGASRKELSNQVEAQKALFRASAAQIAVAAMQAKIEAIKISSEQVQPFGRGTYVQEILAIANAITALADRIENEQA